MMTWIWTRVFLSDALQASIAACALTFAGWLSLGIAPVTPILMQIVGVQQAAYPPSETILEFAVRQGGAFAILLIVLFYYRRDYRDLVNYKNGRDQALMELIRENTKASTDMANAMRENNIIVHAAKNIMRDIADQTPMPPTRRRDDPKL
jgi:hypothetical protein